MVRSLGSQIFSRGHAHDRHRRCGSSSVPALLSISKGAQDVIEKTYLGDALDQTRFKFARSRPRKGLRAWSVGARNAAIFAIARSRSKAIFMYLRLVSREFPNIRWN